MSTKDNENKKLLEQLSYLGLPLSSVQAPINVNELIADTVKSKSAGLWESFPLLLANSNQRGGFSYKKVKELLENNFLSFLFKNLVLLSLAFYRYLNLKFIWADKLLNHFVFPDNEKFDAFFRCLKKNRDIVIFERKLRLKRMKQVFNSYFKPDSLEIKDLRTRRDNLSLEYAMSQIFTPKQKELFLKKFRGQKMSKTEREYFSRVIRKKVLALANPELHNLANATLRGKQ